MWKRTLVTHARERRDFRRDSPRPCLPPRGFLTRGIRDLRERGTSPSNLGCAAGAGGLSASTRTRGSEPGDLDGEDELGRLGISCGGSMRRRCFATGAANILGGPLERAGEPFALCMPRPTGDPASADTRLRPGRSLYAARAVANAKSSACSLRRRANSSAARASAMASRRATSALVRCFSISRCISRCRASSNNDSRSSDSSSGSDIATSPMSARGMELRGRPCGRRQVGLIVARGAAGFKRCGDSKHPQAPGRGRL
jgi:hypothetical protein